MVAYGVDVVFQALADPARRKLLDRLRHRNGQTLTELCKGAPMTRQAVTKHLNLLKKADLVIPLWFGRSKLHYLTPTPLCQVGADWFEPFEQIRIKALIDLKRAIDQNRPA
jgi:DNA-binding transcriptional ArsR family regulator